ncbi:MAG: mechanosensitive ion channel family protein [Solirubrobacterales bacterium]|nr:mechanosensitive ion channel family protein [Solirubrobacterales bacterium]
MEIVDGNGNGNGNGNGRAARLPLRHRMRRIPSWALRAQAAEAARRARRQLPLLIGLLAILGVAYAYRRELFGIDRPIRLATAAVLMLLGWSVARNVARALQPRLTRGLDVGTAGVVGFAIQLGLLAAAVLVSLRLAGIPPTTLAAGAGFTAIVVGLAAQQTIGNIFAGIVLLAARPFRVGDRVRFAGFGMDVEGTVAAHGLLYVTMHDGDDLVLVPNNTALTMSARPRREPAAVDMRARLPFGVDPEAVQRAIDRAIGVSTKREPHVALEEFDGDEVVVRVEATPNDPRDGGRLAREVLDAVASFAPRDAGATPRP